MGSDVKTLKSQQIYQLNIFKIKLKILKRKKEIAMKEKVYSIIKTEKLLKG